MKHTRIITGIAVAAALLALPACKKKTETPAPQPPAKPVCRINTITGGSLGISVTYNNDKRIKTVVSSTSTISYTYAGNMAYRDATDAGGTFDGRMEITNNAAGFPTKVKEYDATNTLTQTLEFTYDANNQLQQSKRTPAGGSSTTNTYTWTNGNLTAVNGLPTSYTFYTDQPFQQGDYLNLIQQFEIGYVYIKNANLIKNMGAATDFTYTFNSDGYITTAASGSTVLNYTYICD